MSQSYSHEQMRLKCPLKLPKFQSLGPAAAKERTPRNGFADITDDSGNE